jgi:hypothetical protein
MFSKPAAKTTFRIPTPAAKPQSAVARPLGAGAQPSAAAQTKSQQDGRNSSQDQQNPNQFSEAAGDAPKEEFKVDDAFWMALGMALKLDASEASKFGETRCIRSGDTEILYVPDPESDPKAPRISTIARLNLKVDELDVPQFMGLLQANGALVLNLGLALTVGDDAHAMIVSCTGSDDLQKVTQWTEASAMVGHSFAAAMSAAAAGGESPPMQ